MAGSFKKDDYYIRKFDGTNFTIWKQHMMDVLVNKGLAAPLKDPKEGAYNDDQWEELDARARATIWLHLRESIFLTIMDKTTAFELWDSLCLAWDGKSASNKVFLMKKLMRLSMKEGSSVSSHLNEFNALYLQLTSKGLNFNDEMKVSFLLCSSPVSWDTFNTAISNSTDGGKLDLVMSLVCYSLRRLDVSLLTVEALVILMEALSLGDSIHLTNGSSKPQVFHDVNQAFRQTNEVGKFPFKVDIAHIAGKHNQVADALSRWPKVNAVSIATHNDLSSMIDEYAIESDYKDVISAIALWKKEEPFTLQDGYLLHGNRLCITCSLREKVMFESHAPAYVGHRGIQTTMKAIETYFYWPTMKGDIQDYVSKCVVCQKTKYDRVKQPGLLQPLPILDSPWESISMDFIFGLPKSIHGNIGIWTIVDRFSKQAHFIPVNKKTIKAHQMATLFISQVFKYHGLPTSIVSDRDPRMTSFFWKGLFENLGTRLNFSSAYHPQTDGQSEIANLTVLDLLKAYRTEVDQRSQWEKYLPLVEYMYNNTVHTSTGKAPFEVIEGRPKSPLLLKVHGKIFVADEYSRDLKESFQKIKEAISIAQQK
ncbi:hypothetical protein L7F22_064356 [Adiantum nelumboides]|nr:hypothetical protein [Adiantum nelumboides]